MLSLPDVDLEVVECGDVGDGMIDRLAPASALAEDLVVFEPGDGVFCDAPSFAESAVGAVFDDAAIRPAVWCANAVAASVAAVTG
ncbi:hypothetical protein [Streptomyces sp. CA-106110]|uniref:hypothetical protein n=1 Tax=Streptomyces sp. CA-106110 TaxID=3240044 RepID=UPI003D9426F4